MKEAIVLAGGLGTRLAHTVSDRQKVMAPAGGRPFLAYVLRDLKNKGFEKAVLAVSYKNEQIYEYFKDEYLGMKLIYSVEKEPLGTGGAIKQAFRYIENDYALVLNGDTYFDADTDALFSLFTDKNADIVLAAKKMPDCTRHSTIKTDSDGKIISFLEKKENKNGYINGGIYIIRKSVFDSFKNGRFSFEKEILEKAQDGLYALLSDGYFIDMGVPEAYFRANTEIPLLFGENIFKAAFLDRDGVICKEKHHLYKPEDFEFIDGAVQAIEELREKGYLIFVITNQAGVAKGLYTEEDVHTLHSFMLELIRDKTHIDGIYYCPYHEDGVIAEYKKYSPDRKPGDGMIKRAIEDSQKKGIIIDLESSILVGDKLSDIEAGKKAGVGKNILVRSGHKEDLDSHIPDIITDSLATLTDLI